MTAVDERNVKGLRLDGPFKVTFKYKSELDVEKEEEVLTISNTADEKKTSLWPTKDRIMLVVVFWSSVNLLTFVFRSLTSALRPRTSAGHFEIKPEKLYQAQQQLICLRPLLVDLQLQDYLEEKNPSKFK